ncbi:MAG: hypothetical protein WDM80_10410 [Limisphaerales bacterium]
MMKISLIGMAAALAVLSSGCGRDSVKVYHVEGTDAAAPAPQSTSAAMPLTMPPGLPTPDNSGSAAVEVCFAGRLAGEARFADARGKFWCF